jgi:1-deoxy-D-xylulose-5-phosphate reductoisomerase
VKRSVTILGSTGSVGINTLNVIREHPGVFEVRGLAAGSNAQTLAAQAHAFSPKGVFLKNADAAKGFASLNGRTRLFSEKEGLAAFCEAMDADILVAATTGSAALLAVLEALGRGKRVALANKEILVAAGALVMAALRKNPGASLIPIDSEHNAVFQCLQGQPAGTVERLILTGSGGPLREVPQTEFPAVSKETVINHPRWKMGPKISVDSATLMNKGLEIIEAYWLFGLPVDKIDVLIHPEAVIHSMIELRDGSILAQLGVTDMRLPIQHALSFPERLAAPPGLRLDLAALSRLTFSRPDRAKFPCLDLAYGAARQAGSAPCVLSAADETAVNAYLSDRIGFIDIPRIIEKVLSRHSHVADPGFSEIRSIHDWAVEETEKLCQAR